MTKTDFFQYFVIAKLTLIGMFVQGQPKHAAFAVGMGLLVLAEIGAFIGYIIAPHDGRSCGYEAVWDEGKEGEENG